jgi:hypothetical protein
MKRFIDLRDQIHKGYPAFAWYDTVVDRFETHGDSQVWESWDDFARDYKGDDIHRYYRLYGMDDFKFEFWYRTSCCGVGVGGGHLIACPRRNSKTGEIE